MDDRLSVIHFMRFDVADVPQFVCSTKHKHIIYTERSSECIKFEFVRMMAIAKTEWVDWNKKYIQELLSKNWLCHRSLLKKFLKGFAEGKHYGPNEAVSHLLNNKESFTVHNKTNHHDTRCFPYSNWWPTSILCSNRLSLFFLHPVHLNYL